MFIPLTLSALAAQGQESPFGIPTPATGDRREIYPFLGNEAPLRVYIPAFYHSLKRYPLVIAVHGGGVDENNYFDSYDHGRIKQVAERFEAIVACPRRMGIQWTTEARSIQAAIDRLSSRYSIDESRIYLMGHSAGGALALALAAFSELPLAAVASLAGPFPAMNRTDWPRIALPVFLAGAEGDDIVPISQMLATRDRLVGSGSDVTFRQIDAQDHNQWIAPLFDELFTWFLSHRKVSNKKESSNGVME